MVDKADVAANSLDAINNPGSLEASLSTELVPYLTCTVYGRMVELVKLSGYYPNNLSFYRCTDTYQCYMIIGRAELQRVEFSDVIRICAFQAVDLSDVLNT